LSYWEQETNGTITLVNAWPADQYDFRPDAGGRSLAELAWHLAEIDGYTSFAIERGEFKFDVKPPHIERPKTIDGLAPVVHEDAPTRIGRLQEGDLHREIRYADGKLWSIRKRLWHTAHARHSSSRSTDVVVAAGWRRAPGFVRAPTRRIPCRRTTSVTNLIHMTEQQVEVDRSSSEPARDPDLFFMRNCFPDSKQSRVSETSSIAT
jgi:hypothetical protein